MNDTCYFTLDMKKLDPTPSLFLINIHPLLSPPPTPQKSLCIPYKLRVGFILTVNLYVTPANPGEIVVYTVEIARGLHVDFILTVNLYVTPANPGEIVVYTV